jgi:Tol biopolymer transport system component
VSPDGTRVLVTTQGDRNIWIYDVARRTTTRLTVEGRSQAAIWTPDGKRVTFGSSIAGTENLFWAPADGTGNSERLTRSPLFQRASAWSPDGQVLAFVTSAQNQFDILTLPNDGNRQPTAVTRSRFNETHPDFSPDSRWLAYASDESGRPEIYVQPYPGPGARVLISTDGGTAPAWARNGQQLFYLAPAMPGKAGFRMMAVPVTLGAQLTAGRPRMLFESTTPSPGLSIRNYDVQSDGRFLAVQFHERSPIRPAQIVLVQNWFEELKRLVSTK